MKDRGNIKLKKQDIPSRNNHQNKIAETDEFSVICIVYDIIRDSQLLVSYKKIFLIFKLAWQSNLYAIPFELIISIILVFISIIGIIINGISLIRYVRNLIEKEDVLFFCTIEFIHWKFGSVGMLLCCIFLAICYLFSHNYKPTKIESLFTINWYYSNGNKWMDILLCFIPIGFQLVLPNMSIKLLTKINSLTQFELEQKQLAAGPIQKQTSNVIFTNEEPLGGIEEI